MSDSGNMATVSEGDYTVVSNTETKEQITESLSEPEKDEKAPTASEIGRKGGEAAAAVKRAKAREARATQPEETGEGDEPTEPEPDAEPEDDKPADKPLGKPRDDPRARMLEATRKEAEAKRETKAARDEAAALKSRLEALERPQPKQESKPTEQPVGKPKPADFETHEEWVEALADWKAEEKFKQRDEQAHKERLLNDYKGKIDSQLGEAFNARREHEKVEPKWFDRVSEDVKAIVNEPSFARPVDKPLGPEHVVADEIIRAGKVGPQITLYLSENPDEIPRLLALQTPQEVQVEMRILAKSLNQTHATPKQQVEVSRAKPPVRPVAGTLKASEDAPDADAPYDAHRDFWNKRDKRARA